MIKIVEVKTNRQAKVFTTFPNKMYKNVKAFVPPLNSDELATFDIKNPVAKYVSSVRYLAYKDNKVVGRIAGLVNHKINYEQNMKQARFTRLDMIDDINVTKALLNAVETWARDVYGLNEMIGPIGFTDMDRQGMLVEGFDQLNMFITIYNFPYYKDHLEKLGYKKDADWVEFLIDWPTEVPEKLAKVTNIIKNRYGYKLVKPKNMKELTYYLGEIFRIYNESFKDLYGFLPLPDDVTEYYLNQFKGIINTDWVWVVNDKNDNTIAFGLVMPSLSKSMKKANGRLFPFGFIPVLKSLKKYDVIDFYLIAVDPKHQNKGVHALIFEDGIKTGIKHGVKYAETGPELETNQNIQNVWRDFGHTQHKRRRCYIKEI